MQTQKNIQSQPMNWTNYPTGTGFAPRVAVAEIKDFGGEQGSSRILI